jgi:hypothetical protein
MKTFGTPATYTKSRRMLAPIGFRNSQGIMECWNIGE